MIKTESGEQPYLVQFTNGDQQADADVLPAKGGQGSGFGPHELLEASLASCINMWIRMQADRLAIPVGAISVSLDLKRDHPEEVVYQYAIKLEGNLSAEQRATLLALAEDCPVRRTLLKRPLFQMREIN
jgi:putative redox protein